MRALIQRVSSASVSIDGQIVCAVGNGVLILLGITNSDTEQLIQPLIEKVVNLRIFPSEKSQFDVSLLDSRGEALIVSQFTLYADTNKGRRPDFANAAKPELAEKLYEQFVSQFRATGLKVETGRFGAHMQVSLVNDGPVTILVEK